MTTIQDMYESKEKGLCPFCKRKVELKEFDDSLSLKEFKISGLCQRCQNKSFKGSIYL